ncbi:hypothetical protein pb186bvf_009739 [Paramecium bursaria]
MLMRTKLHFYNPVKLFMSKYFQCLSKHYFYCCQQSMNQDQIKHTMISKYICWKQLDNDDRQLFNALQNLQRNQQYLNILFIQQNNILNANIFAEVNKKPSLKCKINNLNFQHFELAFDGHFIIKNVSQSTKDVLYPHLLQAINNGKYYYFISKLFKFLMKSAAFVLVG